MFVIPDIKFVVSIIVYINLQLHDKIPIKSLECSSYLDSSHFVIHLQAYCISSTETYTPLTSLGLSICFDFEIINISNMNLFNLLVCKFCKITLTKIFKSWVNIQAWCPPLSISIAIQESNIHSLIVILQQKTVIYSPEKNYRQDKISIYLCLIYRYDISTKCFLFLSKGEDAFK